MAALNQMAPSLTPSSHLNSGFRMYEVDAEVGALSPHRVSNGNQYLQTYDILDAHTYVLDSSLLNIPLKHLGLRSRWYSDVSLYSSLDAQAEHGPTYIYEYSSRDVYGRNISWPSSAPLNATWRVAVPLIGWFFPMTSFVIGGTK